MPAFKKLKETVDALEPEANRAAVKAAAERRSALRERRNPA
jgi:hypothetical protein